MKQSTALLFRPNKQQQQERKAVSTAAAASSSSLSMEQQQQRHQQYYYCFVAKNIMIPKNWQTIAKAAIILLILFHHKLLLLLLPTSTIVNDSSLTTKTKIQEQNNPTAQYNAWLLLRDNNNLTFAQRMRMRQPNNHSEFVIPSPLETINTSISNWYQPFILPFARVFTPPITFHNETHQYYDWCIRETSPSPWALPPNEVAKGLLYVKVFKTSSSTCQGINLQIAHLHAQRLFNDSSAVCIHYNRHEFSHPQKGHGRITISNNNSTNYTTSHKLLWSFVRLPYKRDLSQYFHFRVSRMGMKPQNTKATIQIIHEKIRTTQVYYLMPMTKYHVYFKPDNIARVNANGKIILFPKQQKGNNKNDNNKTYITKNQYLHRIIKALHDHILYHYDFLGVVERMFESLACMKLLWNLPTSDFIVLSAKQTGKHLYDTRKERPCERLIPPQIFPPVQEYFNQQHDHDNVDYLLYHIVNASLDLTIQYLGHENVQSVVQEIQYLQQIAETNCQQKAYFPCSNTGKLQLKLANRSCYHQDSACGYQCVQQVLAQEIAKDSYPWKKHYNNDNY